MANTKPKKKILSRKCKNCEKNKKKCEEYKMGWQRALADYKNLQTEIENKKSEWIKISEVQILEEFLPVYEHLQMSIDSKDVQANNNPWVEGVKYVLKQFGEILGNHGVKQIETVDVKFDPNFHEVVKEEESDKESGIILKQIAAGYTLGEKVIRAAKVIISK